MARDHSPNFEYDVFISHAKEDTGWCRKLATRLEKLGLKVGFTEVHLKSIQITENLNASRHCIVVMTPAYFASAWTKGEAYVAISQDPDGQRQFVVPLLRESFMPPSFLRSLQFWDFRDETQFDDNCQQLANALRRHYPDAALQSMPENKIAEATLVSESYKPQDHLGLQENESLEIPKPCLSPQLMLEQVREKLDSLFEPEEGQRWLYAPQAIFDGRRPIDLVYQGEADRIMQLLIRLEEGIHN